MIIPREKPKSELYENKIGKRNNPAPPIIYSINSTNLTTSAASLILSQVVLFFFTKTNSFIILLERIIEKYYLKSIDEYYLCYFFCKLCVGGEEGLDNRIKDLREDSDLTQQKIAEAIGITQRKYSYIETGTQPLTDELLVRLANYYQVSIDYLLRQTDNPKRNK